MTILEALAHSPFIVTCVIIMAGAIGAAWVWPQG